MRAYTPQSGLVTNRNQLVPYFVIRVMQDTPGMAGFFMATLFSGSLNNLSSGKTFCSGKIGNIEGVNGH